MLYAKKELRLFHNEFKQIFYGGNNLRDYSTTIITIKKAIKLYKSIQLCHDEKRKCSDEKKLYPICTLSQFPRNIIQKTISHFILRWYRRKIRQKKRLGYRFRPDRLESTLDLAERRQTYFGPVVSTNQWATRWFTLAYS